MTSAELFLPVSLAGAFQLAWGPRRAGLGAGPVFPEDPFLPSRCTFRGKLARQDPVSFPGALPRV